MKKLLCILLTLIMLLSLTACNKDENVKKPTTSADAETQPVEQLVDEKIIDVVTSEVAPWTQYSEEEKLVYQELYEQDLTDDQKAQNAMVENQALNTTVVVESCSEGIAVLKITSPDLGKLLVDISAKANLEYSEESVTNVKQLIADALKAGEYTTTEYVVEVEYKILDDGSIDIIETNEYYNALYGGMIALQEATIKQLEEGETNE